MSRKMIALAVVFGVGQVAWGMNEAPVGSVTAWLKSFENVPPLPDGWVECNGQQLVDPASPFDGQIIPDLNGDTEDDKRFLRGANTSGTVGGSSLIQGVSYSQGPAGGFDYQPGGTYSGVPVGTTINPFYDVVWIMKVRSSLGAVPAVSSWGVAIMALLIIAAGGVAFRGQAA